MFGIVGVFEFFVIGIGGFGVLFCWGVGVGCGVGVGVGVGVGIGFGFGCGFGFLGIFSFGIFIVGGFNGIILFLNFGILIFGVLICIIYW